MNVTLINPAKVDDIQQHRWGNGHLGLAYIAGVLESENIKVKVIDAKALGLSPRDIANKFDEYNANIVGMTAMTHEIYLCHEIAIELKRKNPDTTVVIGGPHSTALPERTLEEFFSFDIAVIGEGEKTIIEIVQACESSDISDKLNNIKGISYRKNELIITNELRPFMSSDELNNLPFPAWHLFPDQGFPMFAGRGCPFRCKFCMRVLGNRVRMRSPENVIKEIEYLYNNFGRKASWFEDETFGLNKKWTNQFLDLLEEFNKKYGIKWAWKANSRVNIADYDMYKRMHTLGCKAVNFGIESGNAKILKEIQKDITLEKAIKAIRIAKKSGLMANTFFIIGHPNENLSTAINTIRFAAKLNADSIAVGIMVPYPGTDIWLMAKNNEGGYELLSEDWRLYDKYFGDAIRLRKLNKNQLKTLQSLCYLWFYLRNARVKEGFKFIRSNLTAAKKMIKILFRKL